MEIYYLIIGFYLLIGIGLFLLLDYTFSQDIDDDYRLYADLWNFHKQKFLPFVVLGWFFLILMCLFSKKEN